MFNLQKKLVKVVALVVMMITTMPIMAQASVPNIQITFERAPLFSEANFMPGDAVTRWVKVKNNLPDPQPIAVEVINFNDPDNLAPQLKLVIKEAASTLYTGTLASLYGDGVVNLSNVPSGVETQYDFSVTFNELSGDDYQGAAVSFDLRVGLFSDNEVCTESCEDEDGGEVIIATSGGGGGVPGLYIHTEQVGSTTLTSATITWFTNIPANSRVVYDTTSHPLVGTLPNLGYSSSTAEDSTMTTYHVMVIDGLTPSTTYYFRPVSADVSNTVNGIELVVRTALVAGAYTEEGAGGATPPSGVAFVPPAGSPQGTVAGAEALAQGTPELDSESGPTPPEDEDKIIDLQNLSADCTLIIWLLLILDLVIAGLLRNKYKDSQTIWHKYLWIISLVLILLPALIWYPACWLWIWLLILLVIEILVLLLVKSDSATHLHIEPPPANP